MMLFKRWKWSNMLTLTFLCKLLITSHNLLIPKTATTLYYIGISPIWSLFQDIQCPVIQDSPYEQWGFPTVNAGQTRTMLKTTLSDNASTGSYLFQPSLTKIHLLFWSECSLMTFWNHFLLIRHPDKECKARSSFMSHDLIILLQA